MDPASYSLNMFLADLRLLINLYGHIIAKLLKLISTFHILLVSRQLILVHVELL